MKEKNNDKNENQDDVSSKESKQKNNSKKDDNSSSKNKEKTTKKALEDNSNDDLVHQSNNENEQLDNKEKQENSNQEEVNNDANADNSNLTKEEKEALELEKLQSQLKEINVHELIKKEEEKSKQEATDVISKTQNQEKIETLDNENNKEDKKTKSESDELKTPEEKGEIEIQVLSSKELEIQQNINVIKQELKANKTFKERFKDLFKSKSLKQKEEELITKKAIKAQQRSKSKKEVKFILTQFKSTIGWFSVFYSRSDMKWRILIAFLVGLLMSFVSIVMIQNTGVIISGMSGIFQGIARITKTAVLKGNLLNGDSAEVLYTSMFYGFYLVVSIPLIIFSYFKIGKNFTILSSIPVVVSTVVPLLINLIPGTKELFVFGDTRPEVIKISGSSLDAVNGELYEFGVQMLTFQSHTINGTYITDGSKFGFMFMYTAGAGLLNGLAYSMALAVGGSTGGLDFVSFYYSYKKNKSIGKMLLFFNMGSVLLTSVVGAYIPAIIADGNAGYERFFSQNLVSGIIYSILVALVINLLFPKDKAVKITIYSEKAHKIRDYLYSKNFNHSLTINTTTGGYSMTEKKNIEIICMFIEIPKILREIRYCDIDTLVTITPLKGIEGKLRIENSIN
ncbi:YitT family protein [Malacoplasma iowae]|uniref:YitT family protein n=1 Tax=Malacoplasma iowae TaxID=2116 RepID=UPI002A189255|nr:YitT family protein [Malacoplasma iowae]WPL38133.1 YitT family protein [Malacoplasma iowae]